MKNFIDEYIDMPGNKIDFLIQSLIQNNGKLSKHAIEKEFSNLTSKEALAFEKKFDEIFNR
jgi:hypothetical protein